MAYASLLRALVLWGGANTLRNPWLWPGRSDALVQARSFLGHASGGRAFAVSSRLLAIGEFRVQPLHFSESPRELNNHDSMYGGGV